MKSVIAIVLLIAIVNGFSFDSIRRVAESERAGTTCSVKGSCSAVGGKCTPTYQPAACAACQTTATACITAGYGNATAMCDCFTSFISCWAAVDSPMCPPGALVDTCVTMAGSSCPCTAPSTYPTFYSCPTNAYCVNSTSTCATVVPLGGSCTENSQCGLPTYPITPYGLLTCNAGTCSYANGYAYVNDACSKATDCAGTYTSCTGNVCTGVASGSTCGSTLDCEYGYYCSGGKCAARAALGAACSYGYPYSSFEDACLEGNECISGSCTAPFSVGAGGSCNSTMTCSVGLICNRVTSKCIAVPAAKSCYNNTDCKTDDGYTGTCSCNQAGTPACQNMDVPEPADFPGLYKKFMSCMSANKCTALSYASGSCTQNHCSKEFNCALNSAVGAADIPCMGPKMDCPSPASVIQISLLFVAALVALLL